MSKYCSHCGTQNTDAARFCASCGNAFDALAAAAQPAPATAEATPTATISPVDGTAAAVMGDRARPPLKFGGKTLGAIVAGVLALCVVAGGVLWYQWDQQRQAEQAQRVLLEEQARRQAEAQKQAELDAARQRAEEAERARAEAEQQAAQLAAAQAMAKEQADKAARDQAAQKQQDAMRQRQQADADAARRRQAALESAVRGMSPQMSPEAVCEARPTPLSRSLCYQQECQRPQYYNSTYCRIQRERR